MFNVLKTDLKVPDLFHLVPIRANSWPNLTICFVFRNALEGCPSLQRIDLTSCRELPRGSKRVFIGKELKTLRKTLGKEIKQDSDKEESNEHSEYSDDRDSDSDF